MRQLLYVSKASRPFDEDSVAAIVRSSRDNNALYGVTGILWSDGERFIQVLEGPSASVRETYERIEGDNRHHDLVIVLDRLVEARDFGSWSMCHRRPYDTEDDYDWRLRRILAAVSDPARSILDEFIGIGELSQTEASGSAL